MKTAIVITTLFFILVIGGSAGYVLMQSNDDPQVSESADITPKTSDSKVNGTSQTESQLQIQGQQSQPQPTLPTPDQFSVYEEHRNSDSVLYIDKRLGPGKQANTGDTVAVVYSGYLTSGKLFDQTIANENNQLEPFVFTIGSGQVISGWDQGISGMKVGGQRRLVIPPQYGYGSEEQDSIPADSLLIFDVELVAINGES